MLLSLISRSKLLEEFYESICEQVEDTLGDKVL